MCVCVYMYMYMYSRIGDSILYMYTHRSIVPKRPF